MGPLHCCCLSQYDNAIKMEEKLRGEGLELQRRYLFKWEHCNGDIIRDKISLIKAQSLQRCLHTKCFTGSSEFPESN